jgi:mannosyltransferase OCH1-like enzyme
MNKIPKILHQTNNHLNDEVKKSRDSFCSLHPDWEYRFWSDEDCIELVKDRHPNFYSYWSNLDPPIKKWDSIRSVILYEFGGLYSDIDVLFYKNIEEIIPDNCKLVFRSPTKINEKFDVIKNHFMLSAPNLSFWLQHLKIVLNFANPLMSNPDGRPDFEMDVTAHTGELSLAFCFNLCIKSGLLSRDDVHILNANDVINHNFTNSIKPDDFAENKVYAEHFWNNKWIKT